MFDFCKNESYFLVTDLEFENISAYIQNTCEKYKIIDKQHSQYFKGAFIPQYCIMDYSILNPELINLHNNNRIIIITSQYHGLSKKYTLQFDDELSILKFLNLPALTKRMWLSDYRAVGLISTIQIKKLDKVILQKFKNLDSYYILKNLYFSKLNPDLKKYYIAVYALFESGRN